MCVFCEIASGRTATPIVYEDECCMAFPDSDPIAEGHLLLIPKEHFLDADDLPEELFVHLMRVSRRLVAALKRTYNPDGYSIMQNGGCFNDIGHYHLHLFPRNKNDGFGWRSAEIQIRPDDETAQKIRKNL